jgi:hypothetical protein
MTTSQGRSSDVDQHHIPEAGDWIEVAAAGEGSPRRGMILEVLSEGRHMHFRVRWDEEHVSLFYPAEHHFIVLPASARPNSAA